MESGWIVVNADLALPMDEITLRFARSGGPGGQNVNRTSTRVELLFDVAHSPTLSEHQRALIMGRLRGYIDGEGVLHLFSQATRSQWQNRQDVVERLRTLLGGALYVRPPRHATRPTAAARERRLQGKRIRGALKRQRGAPHGTEE